MFKYIILLSGIFIAMCAGWFSVIGIGQLFIGAPLAAILMAVSLEIGKLTSISYIYRYWKQNKLLRTYMIAGAITLSLITSIGVYGFLSSAYSVGSVEFNTSLQRTEQLNSTLGLIDSKIELAQNRLLSLQNIRQQQEDRADALVGKNGFVTQQRTVQQTARNINETETELTQLIAQKDSITNVKIDQQQQTASTSKLASLNYFATLLGVSLDKFIRWFILLIVFVFDPMSIALIVAYNSMVVKTITSNRKNTTSIKEDDVPTPVIEPSNVKLPDASAEVQVIKDEITPSIIQEIIPIASEFTEEINTIPEIPYYAKEGYDWENDSRWKTDPEARMYQSMMTRSV